jgi:acyl carrier protein phosphodiesterase
LFNQPKQMNYLAHAYLSFGEPSILLGNMISDFVKGKKQLDYPPMVQKGIQLHRAIDQFTDTHAATQKAKTVFKKDYRLYAGAFVDVVYDYFLANDKTIFPNEATLMDFTQTTYAQLAENVELMPPRFAAFFPHMRQFNWLYHYQFAEGIQKSFVGLSKRAAYIGETQTAFAIFQQELTLLQDCYNEFESDIKNFVKAFNEPSNQ